MKKGSKGFTLIELLVVVAIIGILASVVLASLGSARGRGYDAKVKQQLGSMRNQAELYSGTGTAFTLGACATTAGRLFETANNGLGTLLAGIDLTTTRCVSTAGQPGNGNVNWAVAAQLTSGVWCVDSNGSARDRTSAATPVLYTTLTSAITTNVCN